MNVGTEGKLTFLSEIKFGEICKQTKQPHPVGVVLSSQRAAFDDVTQFVGTFASFHNWIQSIHVDASYLSDGLRSLPMSFCF